MRFKFDLRGHSGSVEDARAEPQPFGSRLPPSAAGHPVCTATVACDGRGYAAAFGLTSSLRSTDGASGGVDFEMDPTLRRWCPEGLM